MKRESIPPGEYTAPNPGIICPECKSNNTAFIGPNWVCFNCSEEFSREQSPKPQPSPLEEIGISEAGKWFRKTSGEVVFFTFEELEKLEKSKKEREARWAESDARAKEWEEQKAKERLHTEFIKSLSPEQIEEVRRRLSE